MKPNPVQEMAERLSQVLPPGLASVRDELRDNFRAVLQGQLSELDLVSREQFEVQNELLLRLRKRVAELELRVQTLEVQD
ncbi:MAG: accessory factor UbiK family protein [Oceanococcus sp.]